MDRRPTSAACQSSLGIMKQCLSGATMRGISLLPFARIYFVVGIFGVGYRRELTRTIAIRRGNRGTLSPPIDNVRHRFGRPCSAPQGLEPSHIQVFSNPFMGTIE